SAAPCPPGRSPHNRPHYAVRTEVAQQVGGHESWPASKGGGLGRLPGSGPRAVRCFCLWTTLKVRIETFSDRVLSFLSTRLEVRLQGFSVRVRVATWASRT